MWVPLRYSYASTSVHIIIENVSFQNKSLGVGRCHEVSLLTVQKSALFNRPLAYLKCD